MKIKSEFKQTELGMIPKDWETRTTEELLLPEKGAIKIGPFGSQLKKEFFVPNGFKVYGQDNVFKNNFSLGSRYVPKERFDFLQSCEVKAGDFLISMMGTIGFVTIVPEDIEKGIMDSHLLRLRIDKTKFDKKFLLHLFKSKLIQNQIDSLSVGTIMAGLSSNVIKKIIFPYPSLPEQQRIAKIFSDLDSKIVLNEQMNKTLELMTRSIFKQWFVDFEFSDKTGMPYKSSGGKMIYSEVLRKDIPNEWEIFTLDQIAEFTRGFSYRGSEKSKMNGEYAFVTLNSVKEFGGFKREFSYITSDRVKEKNFVNRGDIVVANTEQTKTGTLLGYPALVEFPLGYEKSKGVFSHHITKVMPKLKNLKHYLYNHLFINQKNAVKYNTGSVIWALDVNNWSKNEKIILPEEKILQKFESLMEIIFLKLLENNLQRENLLGLRDTLLPKLMSGKIRVPVEVK